MRRTEDKGGGTLKWESKCVKTEKEQLGTGGALGVRVLWRLREELREGSWKVRFKISKTSNIPNW